MAEIRLSKIARQFNVGVGTLIEFLNGKGANITSSDPNTKISDEYMPAVESKFGGDLAAKMDSEKVATKLKEVMDVSKKKPAVEDEEADREVIIKTTSISEALGKPAPEKPATVAETPADTVAPAVQTAPEEVKTSGEVPQHAGEKPVPEEHGEERAETPAAVVP